MIVRYTIIKRARVINCGRLLLHDSICYCHCCWSNERPNERMSKYRLLRRQATIPACERRQKVRPVPTMEATRRRPQGRRICCRFNIIIISSSSCCSRIFGLMKRLPLAQERSAYHCFMGSEGRGHDSWHLCMHCIWCSSHSILKRVSCVVFGVFYFLFVCL